MYSPKAKETHCPRNSFLFKKTLHFIRYGNSVFISQYWKKDAKVGNLSGNRKNSKSRSVIQGSSQLERVSQPARQIDK